VETLVKGMEGKAAIVLAGEVSLNGTAPDYEAIARETAASIGYTDHSIGMDATSSELCKVHTYITTQSEYISQGVDGDLDSQGAGDQGIMFGYACNETEDTAELRGRHFPIAAALSQRLTRRLDIIQRAKKIPWMRPDGKSQVSIHLDGNRIQEGDGMRYPLHVNTIVIAVQHARDAGGLADEDTQRKFILDTVWEEVVKHAIPERWLDGFDTSNLIVNGTGSFPDPGGPYSDAGLTGRKIIVDTYGGGKHGGGAFSGKDPSKVDRSAAYNARWAAKHVVAAGLADRCEIQVSYAIGRAQPIGLLANTFGTGSISDLELSNRILNVFDWRPAGMIRNLDLKRPIYLATASGGHFGRSPTEEGHFPWERIHEDRIGALRSD
jgi:S-adenosylmethionine synthetase